MFYIGVSKRAAVLTVQNFSRAHKCHLSLPAHQLSRNATRHDDVDVADILKRPTWSVSSLLCANQSDLEGHSAIVTEKLRLLLKLSALPFPKSPEEQAAKLKALRTRLRFVRDIQTFDTAGITPLQAIRDESRNAIMAQSIGVKEVEHTLLLEEFFGHNRRPRRRKAKVMASSVKKWNVQDTASLKAGRYIVVNDTEQ